MGESITLYRIRDWPILFENNRTKELVSLSWVPIPNKMDGDGYTQLLDHVEGAAHFGAWVALVEIASRCVPRGLLIRDGGIPHDPASLSRLSRIPASVYCDVLPRLLQVGWIEALTAIPQGDAGLPQDDAALRGRTRARPPNGNEGKGIERNGKEEDSSEPPAATEPEMTFPVVGNGPKTWDLLPKMLAELTAAYGGTVDVSTECRKALFWINTNPERRKTARGMPTFLGGWMSRANRRGDGGNRGSKPGPTNCGTDTYIAPRILEGPPAADGAGHSDRGGVGANGAGNGNGAEKAR